ncbi:platelet-activating factor acetylhydrolase IB subunit alpha2 isoform X2 [Dendropsophus ebraccatus]|uniref:platelet-activating factor acetylhydrolase IB subunit alpha2 isoform X2 n=1 Tax=Dendropsophus ebraccatus TaxID=150705 RepID=UPI003831D1A0
MSQGDTNSAAVPHAAEDIQGDGRWLSQHNRFVLDCKDKEPDVLFVGDSMVQLLQQYEVIVLWIGTNNHENSADEVAGGIEAIIKLINTLQPQAKIIVMGLLPRGEKPNPLREKNTRVNQLLRSWLPRLPGVQLLDVDFGFVHSDGAISRHDMFDFLHLTAAGYAKVCRPLHELIMQLLEETPEEKQVTLA